MGIRIETICENSLSREADLSVRSSSSLKILFPAKYWKILINQRGLIWWKRHFPALDLHSGQKSKRSSFFLAASTARSLAPLWCRFIWIDATRGYYVSRHWKRVCSVHRREAHEWNEQHQKFMLHHINFCVFEWVRVDRKIIQREKMMFGFVYSDTEPDCHTTILKVPCDAKYILQCSYNAF